jgi:hypothetical protein
MNKTINENIFSNDEKAIKYTFKNIYRKEIKRYKNGKDLRRRRNKTMTKSKKRIFKNIFSNPDFPHERNSISIFSLLQQTRYSKLCFFINKKGFSYTFNF